MLVGWGWGDLDTVLLDLSQGHPAMFVIKSKWRKTVSQISAIATGGDAHVFGFVQNHISWSTVRQYHDYKIEVNANHNKTFPFALFADNEGKYLMQALNCNISYDD